MPLLHPVGAAPGAGQLRPWSGAPHLSLPLSCRHVPARPKGLTLTLPAAHLPGNGLRRRPALGEDLHLLVFQNGNPPSHCVQGPEFIR